MPADFEKKFKTGRNGDLLLEKPGGGFEKVATVPDGSVAISATLSDQGSAYGTARTVLAPPGIGFPARNPGGGRWTFEELLPKHMPVLVPETVTGLPVSTGVFSMSYDTTEKETGLGSVKLSFSGASAGLQLRCPLTTTAGFGRKPRIGSRMHVRIKCSDWSKVTRFDINVCQNGGVNDFHKFIVANGGVSYFGMLTPGNAAAWSGRYRTLVLWSDKVSVTAGSPTPWGTDDPATRYIETDGLAFYVVTTGAVDFWIDRVYSPEWPVGFVTVIGDGAYKSFREVCIAEFAKRDWRGGVSLFNASGTGIYPGADDIKAISDLGWDVFRHSHNVATGSGWAATNTPTEVLTATYSQNDYLSYAGVSAKGLRWNQFLQNSGRMNAPNLAQVLESQGIAAGRAACSDAQFGIDPWDATVYGQVTGGTKTGGIMTGWASPRGRYNRFSTEWFLGQATPTARDTYAGSAMQKTVAYAANFADGVNSHTHQIVPNYGTNPTIYDSGTNFFRDFLADLDAKVEAGKLLVLSPTELEMLTYWRPGEVFLRWDNEWAYRDDPTKIAF